VFITFSLETGAFAANHRMQRDTTPSVGSPGERREALSTYTWIIPATGLLQTIWLVTIW
jgi:hypothetical protein